MVLVMKSVSLSLCLETYNFSIFKWLPCNISFIDGIVYCSRCNFEKYGYLLLKHHGFSFKRYTRNACRFLYFLQRLGVINLATK